jgi:asparaginyl-tRNA synthetase
MKAVRISDILATRTSDESNIEDIVVQAWVRTKREAKEVIFLEVNDGSTIKNLQIVIPRNQAGIEAITERIHTGTSISACGKIVFSPGENQSVELAVTELHVIGPSDPEAFPLQKLLTDRNCHFGFFAVFRRNSALAPNYDCFPNPNTRSNQTFFGNADL